MSLREKLLAAGKTPKGEVTVDTAEGPLLVEVRGLSMAARGRLMDSCMDTVVGDDGERSQTLNMAKMQPALIIETAHDPESGDRLFNELDRDTLGALSATFVDPIIEMASKLSGLGKDAKKDAEGN